MNGGFAQNVVNTSSLCKLCVLCVSVVGEFPAKVNHRDTEDTEVAHRNKEPKNFLCKRFRTF
jgi:hypothetical protein